MPLRPLTGLACALALVTTVHAQEPHLGTDIQKLSYALGLQIGQNLARQGLGELDPASLALGVQDVITNSPPRLTAEQMQAAQEGYRKALIAKQEAKSEQNLKDGQEFLAANAEREGVIALDSGVQYRVVKAGDGKGESPTLEQTILVHYRGKLLDGREFDSSYSRNEPLTITLSGVISGWQQVVTRMRPGDTVEAWIPPEHGYGERGSGELIGPNSTLHFDIELLEIKAE